MILKVNFETKLTTKEVLNTQRQHSRTAEEYNGRQ